MSEPRTQHGYLLLADISGYTSYVAATELEHAQAVLAELLEIIVKQLTPGLSLAKLEGDAVFVNAPEARLPRAELLLELIECTYAAFRDGVEASRRRTTCECNACRAIPSLDLKFIVHHGDYFQQSIAGTRELVGSDVNLIHRLLKNHVGEATGWRAYALMTEPFLKHLEARPDLMFACSETYEHLGEVSVFALNLRSRYEQIVAARHDVVSPERADLSVDVHVPAAPSAVWDWLNDPKKRALWYSDEVRSITRPGGRLQAGAVNHCVHGKDVAFVETITDWHPFQYFTAEQTHTRQPIHVKFTTALTPMDGGTQVMTRVALLSSMPHLLRTFMLKRAGLSQRYGKMAELIARQESGEPGEEYTHGQPGTHITH